MNLNDYIGLANKAAKEPDQPKSPTVDHSSQTSIALGMAKRQAAPKPEEKPIPSMGAMPIPN